MGQSRLTNEGEPGFAIAYHWVSGVYLHSDEGITARSQRPWGRCLVGWGAIMKKVIHVRRVRDSIELASSDEWEGIDIDESMARYDDLVAARVAECFPDGEVHLSEGTWGAWGFDDEKGIIAQLREIEGDVYADQEWVVWL
jgi:hypothetical protein